MVRYYGGQKLGQCVYTTGRARDVVSLFRRGDIDRPVVMASLYNGQGQEDAPHNQVTQGSSGATGNAPMWLSGNEHGGVLSGSLAERATAFIDTELVGV